MLTTTTSPETVESAEFGQHFDAPQPSASDVESEGYYAAKDRSLVEVWGSTPVAPGDANATQPGAAAMPTSPATAKEIIAIAERHIDSDYGDPRSKLNQIIGYLGARYDSLRAENVRLTRELEAAQREVAGC